MFWGKKKLHILYPERMRGSPYLSSKEESIVYKENMKIELIWLKGLAEAWHIGRVVLDFGVPPGAAMKVRER